MVAAGVVESILLGAEVCACMVERACTLAVIGRDQACCVFNLIMMKDVKEFVGCWVTTPSVSRRGRDVRQNGLRTRILVSNTKM